MKLFKNFDENYAFLDRNIGNQNIYMQVSVSSSATNVFVPDYDLEEMAGEELLFVSDDIMHERVLTHGIFVNENYPSLVNTRICFESNDAHMFKQLIEWLSNQDKIKDACIFFTEDMFQDFHPGLDYVDVIIDGKVDPMANLLVFAAEAKKSSVFLGKGVNITNPEDLDAFNKLARAIDGDNTINSLVVNVSILGDDINLLGEKMAYLKENSLNIDEVQLLLQPIVNRAVWIIRYTKPVKYKLVSELLIHLVTGYDRTKANNPIVTIYESNGDKRVYSI